MEGTRPRCDVLLRNPGGQTGIFQGDVREDLIAFPNQYSGHCFVHEAVCPIGGVLRPKGPFESALTPISGVFHPVKGVNNGLFLLMIKRVGLAKCHILENLRLRLDHKGKVSPVG
jgi:hypothetical protein